MKYSSTESKKLIPASHENPEKPGVLKRVLFERSELIEGRVQMVNSAVIKPGERFQKHYHEDMDEIFLIASGEGVGEVDGERVPLRAGDALMVEAREAHVIWNASDEHELVYFVFGITKDLGGRTVVTEGE